MSGQAGRGAAAYGQAHEYIVQVNPGERKGVIRRRAWRYLLLTASPPLTPRERRAARRARWRS